MSTHRSDDDEFEVTLNQKYWKLKKEKPTFNIKWALFGIIELFKIYIIIIYQLMHGLNYHLGTTLLRISKNSL